MTKAEEHPKITPGHELIRKPLPGRNHKLTIINVDDSYEAIAVVFVLDDEDNDRRGVAIKVTPSSFSSETLSGITDKGIQIINASTDADGHSGRPQIAVALSNV